MAHRGWRSLGATRRVRRWAGRIDRILPWGAAIFGFRACLLGWAMGRFGRAEYARRRTPRASPIFRMRDRLLRLACAVRFVAMPAIALATSGLRKRYRAQVALDGLDLSVPEGVVYGFLGPNGAGKTTTMRILTGLIHPDAGTVELLGRPFGRSGRRRLFEVGALVETPSFYPYLSGRENLRAIAAAGAPVPRGRVDELLALVGLTERAGSRVSGYSLGMRQRLGIAAALLSDPKLLLLDEPANGLDPAGIVGMRDTLRSLAAAGKTIFVSSHILGEVQQLADVVGIIARGRLVREGPIGSLLAAEGGVRVRVAADEVPRAVAAIEHLAGSGSASAPGPEPGWISVRLGPEHASDVNRTLASVGIYASRIEGGANLEALFLELTGDPTGASAAALGSAGA